MKFNKLGKRFNGKKFGEWSPLKPEVNELFRGNQHQQPYHYQHFNPYHHHHIHQFNPRLMWENWRSGVVIEEKDNIIQFKIELNGLKKEDLQIKYEKGYVSIEGSNETVGGSEKEDGRELEGKREGEERDQQKSGSGEQRGEERYRKGEQRKEESGFERQGDRDYRGYGGWYGGYRRGEQRNEEIGERHGDRGYGAQEGWYGGYRRGEQRKEESGCEKHGEREHRGYGGWYGGYRRGEHDKEKEQQENQKEQRVQRDEQSCYRGGRDCESRGFGAYRRNHGGWFGELRDVEDMHRGFREKFRWFKERFNCEHGGFKDSIFHRYERKYEKMTRGFRLPENVDPTTLKAKFTDGVLEITVDKKVKKDESVKINIE